MLYTFHIIYNDHPHTYTHSHPPPTHTQRWCGSHRYVHSDRHCPPAGRGRGERGYPKHPHQAEEPEDEDGPDSGMYLVLLICKLLTVNKQ